jgi:hypothetical protein
MASNRDETSDNEQWPAFIRAPDELIFQGSSPRIKRTQLLPLPDPSPSRFASSLISQPFANPPEIPGKGHYCLGLRLGTRPPIAIFSLASGKLPRNELPDRRWRPIIRIVLSACSADSAIGIGIEGLPDANFVNGSDKRNVGCLFLHSHALVVKTFIPYENKYVQMALSYSHRVFSLLILV